MKRLNKKGFTLVELLAVIVILALIMAIAIYSISGILQNSREGVFKDTALSIIRGVKNQLLATNQQAEGTYYFSEALLENNNDLPFGGKIKFRGESGPGTQMETSGGNSPLYSASYIDVNAEGSCTSSTTASYVSVDENAGTYTYYICLIPTATGTNARYIRGSEADLMGSTARTIYPMG